MEYCRNAGFDPAKFRVDPYGNVVYWNADPASPLAWEIDHWFPHPSRLPNPTHQPVHLRSAECYSSGSYESISRCQDSEVISCNLLVKLESMVDFCS